MNPCNLIKPLPYKVEVYDKDKKLIGNAVSLLIDNNTQLIPNSDGQYTVISTSQPLVTAEFEDGTKVIWQKANIIKSCSGDYTVYLKDKFDEVYHNGNWSIPYIPYDGNGSNFDTLSTKLPGVNERVSHPVTKTVLPIRDIVMNLNDRHKWTREAIADWLDTLDVDLSFKVDKT